MRGVQTHRILNYHQERSNNTRVGNRGRDPLHRAVRQRQQSARPTEEEKNTSAQHVTVLFWGGEKDVNTFRTLHDTHWHGRLKLQVASDTRLVNVVSVLKTSRGSTANKDLMVCALQCPQYPGKICTRFTERKASYPQSFASVWSHTSRTVGQSSQMFLNCSHTLSANWTWG